MKQWHFSAEARARISKANTKHGMRNSPTYKIWFCMRQRCRNPKHPAFDHYGGRGIGIDPRWDDFATFLADMGERPPGMEIDRIDNDKGYSKENCRWATSVQNQNNRSNNHWLRYEGRSVTVAQASRLCGVKANTIYERLKRGWTDEQAVRPCAR
jgi:hypothetical protein